MVVLQKMYRLYGKIQHYTWGGFDFIPNLLGIKNTERKPFAEYWMGAHHSASAQLGKELLSLHILLQEQKEELLGAYVAREFGDLPYLFKILDVKDMLSIQVHPSRKEAEKEFARENKEGIPLTDPARNYKDANHKPELMVALSDFWLLHGFKPADELQAVLQDTPELQFLLPIFKKDGYEKLYRTVMELPQREVNERLQPLLDRIIPLYNENSLSKSDENFWAARAALTFHHDENFDRGIFSIYLFNLVYLKPGEGIFQDAGVPHAYLEGQNAEIMANSDNVLRGGLTAKHIDVKQLLKHVQCRPVRPQILTGKINEQLEIVYKTPAKEFELSRIVLRGNEKISYVSRTGEVLLLTEGRVRINVANEITTLNRGEAVFIVANQPADIKAAEDAVVFRATVPVHKGE